MARTTNVLMRYEEWTDDELNVIIENNICSDETVILSKMLLRMQRFLQGIDFGYVEELVAHSHMSDGEHITHSSNDD